MSPTFEESTTNYGERATTVRHAGAGLLGCDSNLSLTGDTGAIFLNQVVQERDVPNTGHLVFNSSMEAVALKTRGPRSRADKDAALHLKRAGGACPRHKASKKRVSQWLLEYWLALTSSTVSL